MPLHGFGNGRAWGRAMARHFCPGRLAGLQMIYCPPQCYKLIHLPAVTTIQFLDTMVHVPSLRRHTENVALIPRAPPNALAISPDSSSGLWGNVTALLFKK